MGGGAYFDILAVKGYGFWTGPADRRVESDVLNFSRAIAAREIMGDFGDRDKPVWAVEWGWHVSPASEANRPISWGTDRAFVQGERIVGAVDRAGVEWPWMTVMCWAEYQPQTAADDPRWGFALRDIQGEPTALYDVLRIANEPGQDTHSQGIYTPRARWVVLWAAIGVGWAVWGFLAVQQAFSSGTSLPLEQALPLAAGFFTLLWREWCRQPAWLHGMVVVILGALVALTPWPEWVLFELALAVAVFWLHPRWPVILAVGFIPFFYATKPLGDLDLSASELLMYLAVTSAVAQRLWRAGSLRVQYNWHVLDVVWILWMLWGAGSASSGPNSRLAWREWRLCFLGPWLLYLWLRLAGKGWLDRGVYLGLIGAWLGSAAIVTGVGVVQGFTGAWVPAGSVGRVTGVYYSPNHLALYLERVWPLTLVAAIGLGSRKSWRRVAVGLAFVMGAILFLTYSRGAWLLGVPTALLVVGWAYRGRLRWWMAAGMALGVVLMASNVLLGRMATSAGLLDIRVPVWVSTWRMILDHPWMGVGLAGFRFVYPRYMYLSAWSEPVLYHPHNMWLDAAVRSGLPGMVFFGALVCLSTVSLARWARATGGIAQVLAVGCLAGCLAGVAHGMVDSGYFVGDLAWILALTGGLAQRWLDRCCPAIDMI
jgi:O-antigen ligase